MTLDRTQAELDRAAGQLQQAQAQLKLAQADLDRAKDLRQKNVIAANEFDNRAAAFLQSQGTTSVAQAAVAMAKLNLEFCYIHAPISGRISRENVTAGNLVQPNTGQDGVLTTIVAVDPLYAYLDVDENAMLNYIKLNEEGKLASARDSRRPIFLGLPNEQGFPHEGFVEFVDNRVAPGTGTMRVRGQWKTWDPSLTPGFFVRVRVAASPSYKTILVPDEAIGTDQGQRYVLVVGADRKVQYRPVKLGTISDGLRVIHEGLRPGELVVVDGLMSAPPGSVVDPQPVVPAPPATASIASDR